MRKPRLNSVQKRFRLAKSIICLKTKLKIDVTGIKTFEYSAENKVWTSVGGAVCFWRNGDFAQIVESKDKRCKCKNCDCNKAKNIKRNQKKL